MAPEEITSVAADIFYLARFSTKATWKDPGSTRGNDSTYPIFYLTKTKLGQIVFLATISASSHRTGIKPTPLSWFDIRRTYFGSPGLILLNPIDKSGAKDHPI